MMNRDTRHPCHGNNFVTDDFTTSIRRSQMIRQVNGRSKHSLKRGVIFSDLFSMIIKHLTSICCLQKENDFVHLNKCMENSSCWYSKAIR
uniref:Uncharacterized protein n=1 Tax=Romanomermis culicivorax TaxID=13658 RepID=A0A915JSG8_ROMCU